MVGATGILESLPGPVRRRIGGAINAVGPVRRLVSKRIINEYAYRTPPRPRAISMAADYALWPGLTDRRFSGRHLPAPKPEDAPRQPDLDQVTALFKRAGKQRSATDTSILFPLFAQWFVDSFLRTKWEPGPDRRFRHNESNHEIDLCQIYGISEVQTTMLREGAGGRLSSQTLRNGEGKEEVWPSPLFEQTDDGRFELIERYRRRPEVDEDTPAVPGLYTTANFKRVFDSSWTDEEMADAFAVGLEHGNSTLSNVVMNTLFLRHHNWIAGELEAANRAAGVTWDDEHLFQVARNVNIVCLLNIVIGDYIGHVAPLDIRLEAPPGMAEEESWYRNNWMAVEFALLYRWHDLVPDELRMGNGETLPGERMRRANTWLKRQGLDRVLVEASRQRAGRIGLGNTPAFLVDVKRVSIEMARACNLPSYNAYRRYYGLKPVGSFEELTGERETAEKLRGLYGDIDKLEWFVGLFAENYGSTEMMGELLKTMVANDAFTQALTNPLLAKKVYSADTFSRRGLEIVEETKTLAQVAVRCTGVKDPAKIGFKVREA